MSAFSVRGWSVLRLGCLLAIVAAGGPPHRAAGEAIELTLRSRQAEPSGSVRLVKRSVRWDAAETAVIVCDMWDLHHCLNATRRGAELAPRMNEVLVEARRRGSLVIHAPSSCMDFYKNHPARRRAQAIPRARQLPDQIGSWCYKIPAEEQGVYPLDQSDGGEDDDPREHLEWARKLERMGRNPKAPWIRQTEALTIADGDLISDSGEEIWSALEHHEIRNVILLGVHTNMCVLGRPFGLRQLVRNGKRVVLMRDMTDTMYNPDRWPYVSHFQGTDLIVQHIEKYVCPTVTSDQLLGGRPFRFQHDRRPRAVVVIAEPIYKTSETLPPILQRILVDQLGLEMTVVLGDPGKHDLPGLVQALEGAELLVLSVRRQALPRQQFEAIRAYLEKGGPLLALRTSSHAFDAKGQGPTGHVEWPDFDPQVLGGNYRGHYPDGPLAQIEPAQVDVPHPLLRDFEFPDVWTSRGSLYRAGPLVEDARPILMGRIEGQAAEPVAWTHRYGKSRVFYTSLGHPEDFEAPAFAQLLHHAARWCTEMKIGK